MALRARSHPIRLACALGLLAVCTASRPTLAQSTAPQAGSPAAEQRRTALYRTGVEAAAAGRWAEAKQKFVEAGTIRASAKVFFSLAQTEEQLGEVASAEADYGRALESAKAAGESQVVLAADHARAALAPLVPHIRVLVTLRTASPASLARDPNGGAAATLDDQPLSIGTSVAVDPGAHRVVVTAPGMDTVLTNVAIGKQQQLDVPVRLEPAGGGVASAPTAETPTSRGAPQPEVSDVGPTPAHTVPWRTIGLVVAGAGVVALGIGAYFAVDAKSDDDQSYSQGCKVNACPSNAAATRRDALSAANASTVAFVVGGVVTAGGLALSLAAPHTGAVRVEPVAWGSGGGLLVTGRWR
jgi:hypothetical protein